MTQQRVQRKRTKGWRMPPGAIYVGRPSRWGNPWRADHLGSIMDAVVAFEQVTVPNRLSAEPDWLEPLRGHDLVCWCSLGVPCHADVLLELLA